MASQSKRIGYKDLEITPEQNPDEDIGDLCDVIMTFHCKSCQFVCGEKAALVNHFKESHGTGNAFANNAKATIQTEPQIIEPANESSSTRTDDEKEVFLCAECNIVFPSEEACCDHMIDIHGLKDFDANLIRDDRSKKAPVELQRRNVKLPKCLTLEGGAVVPKKYRVTKDMPLRCSMCPIRFQSSETIKLHEQCHIRKPVDPLAILGPKDRTITTGFSCLICSTNDSCETFSRWSKCAMHLWKVHKINCDLYGCPTCEFKTHLVTKLKEHEDIHTNNPSFKCEACHKTFKQQKQLKTHEKYHKVKMTKLPPPEDSRWYTPKECSICKRVLSDSKCLKKHISAVHNKLKPYVCNICGHTSARKAELQLHIRQHTGEKPFKCSTCEFATGDHNSLRKHQLRHTEIRPYACPFCKYRCIQSCAYKKHMISVHPDKDAIFACPFCPLISVSENLFQAHIKDHEDGRLPSLDMQNESSSSPTTPIEITKFGDFKPKVSSAPETTKIHGKRKPSELQYWMRDEDSIDMVDTGGITIPAPPEATENGSSTISNDIGVVIDPLLLPKQIKTSSESSYSTIAAITTIESSNPNLNSKNLWQGVVVKSEFTSNRKNDADKTTTSILTLETDSTLPSTSVELALEEVFNTDQTNNDRMFARLLGLKMEGAAAAAASSTSQ